MDQLESGAFQIIFSNELLDAMPVHRLGWDASEKVWFEWGVALERDCFVWHRLPITATSLPPSGVPARLLEVLPNDFSIELSPVAENWWRDAARTLSSGKLMAIDYGLTRDQFFLPERSQGTLRAYREHRLSPDILMAPGEQDITAHVNFSALQAVGESVGLRTDCLVTQSQFLTRMASKVWKTEPPSQAQTRQFQTLTHPTHLGDRFHVLVQSR